MREQLLQGEERSSNCGLLQKTGRTAGILCSAIMLMGSVAGAKVLLPMNYVEKSAYALATLVKQKAVDPHFLTDVNTASISVDPTGATIVQYAPSADSQHLNSLTLKFDLKGKMIGYQQDFVSASPRTPIFSTGLDSSNILDFGAEAIVDHLVESPDLPVVAAKAVGLQVLTAAEVQGAGPHVLIHLDDQRVYGIQMNGRGDVVTKGFITP